MKIKALLLTLLTFSLSSCIYGNRQVSYELDASFLASDPSPVVDTKTIDGYEYSFVNVSKDDKNNFVFEPEGYFRSNVGVPNNMLSIYTSLFVVYGINETNERTELVSVQKEDSENDTYEYRYNLSAYYNFEIINPTDSTLKLGKMIFWA